MIQNLQIENYKSLRSIKLPCKKLNVFIGEPNSGKSNIIEALRKDRKDKLPNLPWIPESQPSNFR